MTKEQKDCDCTPRLRFPEFVGGKKWRKISLGELADRNIRWSFSGGPFGSNLKSSDYTESGIRIIQLQNIGDSCFLDNYKIFTSKQKADELLSCNIYPGEIILAKMGDPVARSCIVPTTEERYLMCSDGIRLVVDKNNYSSTFTFYLINSKYFRKKAEEKSTGSTRKRIGLDELKSIPILIPILQEQQKIARCLSSLDDLIEVHEQKLDALQRHKKGMMQRLFPAEGETTPRWRFPEFRNAGEWVKVNLGTLIAVAMCRRIFSEETSPKGDIPFYKIGTLGQKADAFISYALFQNYKNKYKYPKKGEILLTCSGTIGKMIRYSGEDAYYQDSNIVWLENDQKIIINELLFYLLKKLNWNKLNTTTITRIYANDLKNILISFPIKKTEQQRIADCLSSLDERITAQEEIHTALLEHKKGLMQQLFPK